MPILPCLKYELRSSKSIRDVANRLYRFVDPRYEPWWDTPETDPIDGEATVIRFQLIPVKRVHSKYNRTYEPIVTGRIEKEGSGAKVHLIMRVNRSAEWLLYIWLCACAVVLWRVVTAMVSEPGAVELLPIAFVILFGLFLPGITYYHTRQEAELLLTELRKRI